MVFTLEEALEMIKVEPCKGCGGVLLVDRFMGVTVRCDPTPLDAQAAAQALLARLPLYRVVHEGGRPHQFTAASQAVLRALGTGRSPGLQVVPEHRCTPEAAQARLTAFQPAPAPTVQQVPANPPVGRTAPFSAPSTAPSSVRSVANPASSTVRDAPKRGPRCSGCGQPCADGTYGAIHLGEILVWAHHVEDCGKE